MADDDAGHRHVANTVQPIQSSKIIARDVGCLTYRSCARLRDLLTSCMLLNQ
jgi:hypothetical protein